MSAQSGPEILWFRRDLRLGDLPALQAASASSGVAAVFVLDQRLLARAGSARRYALASALEALDADLDGRLHILSGDPVELIGDLARELDAPRVHVTGDFGPTGARRDAAVGQRLERDGRTLERSGSPYAVSPGSVYTGSGTPYKVFSAFRRAWYERGRRAPADTSASLVAWAEVGTTGVVKRNGASTAALEIPTDLPAAARWEVSEAAARRRWAEFLDDGLAGYATDRDRPDHDRTSRLSAQLKFGTIHPRTLLADLGSPGPDDGLDDETARGREAFASELCWREFYADVLHHRPETAWGNVDGRYDDVAWSAGAGADEDFAAWVAGRTGYPIVDAGMRQLAAEGWMHNRLRMIVASFLTKDLHIDWRRGARHFMDLLVDGDLASNQHGWQWVAGSGTDAAPYFRVFNPVTQGEKFDPDGDYVRRWVPELAGIGGKAVHRPRAGGVRGEAGEYPPPIVDHAEARREALDRYERALKG